LVRQQPNIIIPYESYSLFLDRQRKRAQSLAQRLMLWAQLQAARRYEQAMFSGYDRVVVLSEIDAQALHALQPALPLRVIPNGVDIEHFIPADHEPDQPVLLFTGNFSYPPNVDGALWLAQDIFSLVQQRIPQARLMLVGNNPPANLIGLASDAIHIPGYVPDLRPYLQQALIFVSPLRFGAGIKNKVLEAMAMQKPVVATPLSCDGIGLTEGEHVLYGTSADELASAVIRLIQDGALRQRMAQANRQWIEAHYTWQRVADQYEALYQEVIGARKDK
jgi:glycosyltransferase involved in cell wall biosynthesis